MRRITTTIGTALGCAAIGAVSALGVAYAADSKPSEFGTPAATYGRALTASEIDVLTEGDEWDHPWESCRVNSDLWVTCPDGYKGEYPLPSPAGAVSDPGAHAAMLDLDPCEGPDDEPTNIPCRVPMAPTYVVDGAGLTHLQCTIALTTDEDSEMVCADDTVWPS